MMLPLTRYDVLCVVFVYRMEGGRCGYLFVPKKPQTLIIFSWKLLLKWLHHNDFWYGLNLLCKILGMASNECTLRENPLASICLYTEQLLLD